MDSERLREAARTLADTMTEQEKQRLVEQWMEAAGADPQDAALPGGDDPTGDADRPASLPQHPSFEGFDDIDLRGDEMADEVIAEWLSDAPFSGAPPRTEGRAAVRRARSAAQQAVEKSVVPSRYHQLIQRYFGRLQDTVEKADDGKP